jgi:hypothetical protein
LTGPEGNRKPAVRGARRLCYAKLWPPGAGSNTRVPLPTMHGWTAKHYVITAVIILIAVGAFAYRWS